MKWIKNKANDHWSSCYLSYNIYLPLLKSIPSFIVIQANRRLSIFILFQRKHSDLIQEAIGQTKQSDKQHDQNIRNEPR